MFSWFRRGREIKLICFDVDNTLCDFASAERETEAYVAELMLKEIQKLQSKTRKRSLVKNYCSAFTILKYFNEVKSRHLYQSVAPEAYSRMLWFKETIEKLDESMSLGISVNSLIKNAGFYEKKYWEHVDLKLKNYPNTISTLDFLKSKGFKLATITDSDGKAGIKDHRLKMLGLDKYFDYIITGDEIGMNKPAVENWNKLSELSGLTGKQCMMVGDHPEVDLITAKKLGFITVWTKQNLNTDLHQKYIDYEIHDIKEITNILKKFNYG